MKKRLFLLCIATGLCCVSLSACNKAPKEPTKEEQSAIDENRIVEVTQCGLKYYAPDAWKPYETTNIIPIASTTTEGDIYAHVQYSYVTDENMEKLSTLAGDLDTKSLLAPFVEVLVLHKDKLDSDQVKAVLAQYNKQEEVATQGDYHYYVLSEYNGDISYFSEKDKEAYKILQNSIPEFTASISTFAFDESEVAEAIDKLNRTITFDSFTLEGEKISSQIFAEYDLTIVNFWASYCYPDINETKVMQNLKEALEKKYPNVNLIQVVIDTPTEEAEKIALQAKKEVNADFTSVMTDPTFAAWITKNLQGLPTTIFVDSNGEAQAEQIQGVHDADFYLKALEERLSNQ